MAAAEPGADTTLCFSVAARPGRFGATVFNAAFRALELDYLYKPFACSEERLGGFVSALRLLGVRGCGVSMPFKSRIMQYLDRIDPVAEKVGAVNTVVNDAGQLIGYNTDVDGARAALAAVGAKPGDRVLLLGAGGMARAMLHALDEAGMRDINIAQRKADAAMLRNFPSVKVAQWEARERLSADLLINATPIGMMPDDAHTPLEALALNHFRVVIDVVPMPRTTRLVAAARALGLPTADGACLALAQAAKQFELYTGQAAPLDVMREAAGAL